MTKSNNVKSDSVETIEAHLPVDITPPKSEDIGGGEYAVFEVTHPNPISNAGPHCFQKKFSLNRKSGLPQFAIMSRFDGTKHYTCNIFTANEKTAQRVLKRAQSVGVSKGIRLEGVNPETGKPYNNKFVDVVCIELTEKNMVESLDINKVENRIWVRDNRAAVRMQQKLAATEQTEESTEQA